MTRGMIAVLGFCLPTAAADFFPMAVWYGGAKAKRGWPTGHTKSQIPTGLLPSN